MAWLLVPLIVRVGENEREGVEDAEKELLGGADAERLVLALLEGLALPVPVSLCKQNRENLGEWDDYMMKLSVCVLLEHLQ